MARISTYNIDQNVTAQDKFIGTDSSGGVTKNFTFEGVTNFLNNTSAIAIAGQNNFFFQTDLSHGRNPGTISFSSGGGVNTAFNSLTTIRFSRFASSGNNVLDYLQTLVDKNVILVQIDDVNNFGVYKLLSLDPVEFEPDFYDAAFEVQENHGALLFDKFYAFAIYSGAATAPQDLQSVTDVGNTTDNNIIVENMAYTSTVMPGDIVTQELSSNKYSFLSADGIIGMGNGSQESKFKNTNVTNPNVVLEFPNKPAGSYTIATTSDVSTSSLQDVTNVGNSTTNSLNVQFGNDYSIVNRDNVYTADDTNNRYAYIENSGTIAVNGGAFEGTIRATNLTVNNVNLEFPQKAEGSYTIATTADVPSTPSLQDVTTVNNTTTTEIISESGLIVNSADIPDSAAYLAKLGIFSILQSGTLRYGGSFELRETSADGSGNVALVLPSALTADRLLYLPNKDGILAVTTDLPTQYLTSAIIDSNIGDRLKPLNVNSNGFYFNRSADGSVGYTATNTNTGNAAVVSHGVGIDTNSYIKNIFTAKFGPNYFVPLLAGKGGLLGTEEVFVGSTDNNDVSILTGSAFASMTRKFTVKANGQLLVQTTPTTGTTSDFLLLRDTSGNVKQIAYPTIDSIPTDGSSNAVSSDGVFDALALKADLVGGKVPASQLPSYVDDVVEVANFAALPVTGEIGKIYVTLDTGFIYRWTGTVYVQIATGGSVTSVGLTMPSAFSVSNSPITSTGDIAVTGAGTTLQYIRGDGTLATLPTSTSTVAHAVKYGEAITIGQAVYVTSADGTNIVVSKASNISEATSSKTMGLVTASGALNYQGVVVTEGLVTGLNTNSGNEGDPVWLGTNGNLIFGLINKPVAPAHLVFIGILTRKSATNGEIFVRVQNGFELQELHNVLIDFGVLANNDVLAYDSATLLWKNKQIGLGVPFTKQEFTYSGSQSFTLSAVPSYTYLVTVNGQALKSTQYSVASNVLTIANTLQTVNGQADEILIIYSDSVSGVLDYYTKAQADALLATKVPTSTSILTTAPLTGGGDLSTNRTLSMPPANSGQDGFLYGTDFSYFSDKQEQISLTTDGYSGLATFSGTVLNIPNYGGFIPTMVGNETFRGVTFSNNSTTDTVSGGVTISTTASVAARSVASTNYATKQIRKGYFGSVVSAGRYTGVRGSALLWYMGGGFKYICDFHISDSAFGSGCRQFYGLAGQTTDLGYSDSILVSSLTNIMGVGSDALDTNLQVFYNDATGTATKIDLGVNFPANRTAGAGLTTVYSVELYNAPNSTELKYFVTNKETGTTSFGIITTNLPLHTQGLNFFASRCMGAGVTNTGQFDLLTLGVYSI